VRGGLRDFIAQKPWVANLEHLPTPHFFSEYNGLIVAILFISNKEKMARSNESRHRRQVLLTLALLLPRGVT
jgi:hypothetical protein